MKITYRQAINPNAQAVVILVWVLATTGILISVALELGSYSEAHLAIGIVLTLVVLLLLLFYINTKLLTHEFTMSLAEEGIHLVNNSNGEEKRYAWAEVKEAKTGNYKARSTTKEYLWITLADNQKAYLEAIKNSPDYPTFEQFRTFFLTHAAIESEKLKTKND